MYVCMYVRMYVCMHVCKYVCMYVCMHACMHACMYVCMYVCICVYIYIYTYVYTMIYYMLVCICVHMCVYVYIYIYIYIHGSGPLTRSCGILRRRDRRGSERPRVASAGRRGSAPQVRAWGRYISSGPHPASEVTGSNSAIMFLMYAPEIKGNRQASYS